MPSRNRFFFLLNLFLNGFFCLISINRGIFFIRTQPINIDRFQELFISLNATVTLLSLEIYQNIFHHHCDSFFFMIWWRWCLISLLIFLIVQAEIQTHDQFYNFIFSTEFSVDLINTFHLVHTILSHFAKIKQWFNIFNELNFSTNLYHSELHIVQINISYSNGNWDRLFFGTVCYYDLVMHDDSDQHYLSHF